MKSLEDVRPGDALGRYELLAPVAQGGMAAVWAARFRGSRGFQRVVAIKTILPSLVEDPMFEQMFLDEASLASRIRHPHVAQILDLGEEEDVLYLVMEWVDGESLSILSRATNKVTGKPVPIPIAARIIMQAAAGLHAAHELRDEDGQLVELVHRDVSPQNILLTYDGSVKVVDFGVAKAIGRSSTETSAGQLKGKLAYMSPEQALGGHVDRRTDIFALGTIFYQLITGKHPFRGENDLETLSNITQRPLLRPRLVDASIPEEIDTVLMTALAKDAGARYPTMSAFEAALGEAVAKLGMVANDSTVAGFVGELLGARAQKRRDALKQAMVAADEQAAGWRDAPLAISPSHSGLTPPPGYSPNGRRTTPPSLAAVASDRPEPLRDVPTVIAGDPRTKKRAALAGGIALLAIATVILVAVTRGEAESPDASLPIAPEPGVAAAAKAGVEMEADEERGAEAVPAASAIADEEEAPPQLPALAADQEEDEEAVVITATNQGRATRPANAVAPRAPVPTEAAPAAPKRRRMPEVQDPGF